MGCPLEFWYDQFLAKPPQKGAATLWHQDEGYWGRNLDDLGITCWMPFHDVDERNGCMHFIDGGHRDGVLAASSARERAERPAVLRARRVARRRVPDPASAASRSTTEDAAHDDRRTRPTRGASILTQHLRKVGAPGRGRPLPVEGVRQPDHRRTHGPAHPLTRPAGLVLCARGSLRPQSAKRTSAS